MLDTVKDVLELISYASTAFGVPIAIAIFWNEKKKESFDREWGTYNALDDKYIRYLELCIQYPHLDLYNVGMTPSPELSKLEEIQRLALFEVLVATLERSYLMYHEHSSVSKRSQWIGWLGYIEGWAVDPRFPPMWRKIVGQYDAGFVNFVESRLVASSPVPQ